MDPKTTLQNIHGRWEEGQVVHLSEPQLQLPDGLSEAAAVHFETFRRNHPDSYDGNLVRLHEICPVGDKLLLRTSPARFSWYLATRHPEIPDGWPRADPIGTTSILVTRDEHVLVTVRSLQADQNAGGLYYVGGLAEYEDDGRLDLFDNAKREVEEEVGLSNKIAISDISLIGFDYDPVFPHPEAFFRVEIPISSLQLRTHLSGFTQGEAERFYVVSLSEFMALGSEHRPLTWSFEVGRKLIRKS